MRLSSMCRVLLPGTSVAVMVDLWNGRCWGDPTVFKEA
jgi:hypothetical protein